MPPKAKASEIEGSQDKARAPRPLFAELTAAVQAQQVQGDKKTNGGRWGLNAGSVMVTAVSGLNTKHDAWGAYAAPINLVVDLASAKFAKPVMPALCEHWWHEIVGNWSNGEITAKGITADLAIYEARTAAEASVLGEAVRAKALLEQGHPWQASIGAYPEGGIEDYEEIEFGKSVEVNGVTLTADDADVPLYVMRNAVITESSICTFGADDDTGPLAASRMHGRLAASARHSTTQSQGSAAMKYNLRAMLALFAAHAALVAEHVAAAQELPEDKQPTPEALQASIATAVGKAELAAKDKEIADLRLSLEESKKPKPKTEGVQAGGTSKPPAFEGGSGEGEGSAPATLHEAMAQMHAENDKLKGFKLRAAALKRWPELRKTVPDAQVGAAR